MHSPKGDPIFRYHLDRDACGPETILTEPFKQALVPLEVAGGSSAALLRVLLCIETASDAAPRAASFPPHLFKAATISEGSSETFLFFFNLHQYYISV